MRAVFRGLALACEVGYSMPLTGCASSSRRVTREETVRTTPPSASAESNSEDHGQGVETHTTVTDEEKDDHTGGIISTTVAFIGEVIAFPFRLVGAVFRTIF